MKKRNKQILIIICDFIFYVYIIIFHTLCVYNKISLRIFKMKDFQFIWKQIETIIGIIEIYWNLLNIL